MSGTSSSEHLDDTLGRLVVDPTEREWLRPRLAVLVGAGGGGFAREDLFAAWTAFFEHLAAGEGADDPGPVVLVIDDAQYADEGLLDFVDHVLATAQRTVFVVALARPELLARRHDLGGRRTTVVRVDPLDDTAMGRLLDGLVEGLPAATRSALIERAEGVPLFAVETIRALIDRDAVIPRGGRYVPADGVEVDLDAIGAPASLQALIAARLDALSPAERRVVTDASVLGTAFSRDGVAHLDQERRRPRRRPQLAGAQGDHRPDDRPVLGGRGPVPVRPGDGPPGRLRDPVPTGPQAAPPRGRGVPLGRTRCRGPGRGDSPAPAGRARRLRRPPIRTARSLAGPGSGPARGRCRASPEPRFAQ